MSIEHVEKAIATVHLRISDDVSEMPLSTEARDIMWR
jgi:hypothetical protein